MCFSERTLDAAIVGGALAKVIQLFFIHWLVIDIYPCCCDWSMGRGEPAVVIQWLRRILITLIFQCLNLGTLGAAAVAVAEVSQLF